MGETLTSNVKGVSLAILLIFVLSIISVTSSKETNNKKIGFGRGRISK